MSSFDEYQLFANHVSEMVNRRQRVTSTYLTVNFAILSIAAFFLTDAPLIEWAQQLSIIGLFIVGLIACDLWRRLITQYRVLLGWWYAQLRMIEESLTQTHKLFSKEHADLYDRQKSSVKVGLSRYEVSLTWLISGIYGSGVLVALGLLLGLL